MSEMVRDHQAFKKEERYDIFSNLLDANIEDSADAKLTESELIGMSLTPCGHACFCFINKRNARKYIYFPDRRARGKYTVHLGPRAYMETILS